MDFSAGVGRTGTYIAYDNLVEELQTTDKVDVKKAVLKMRENRKDMIQNTVGVILSYPDITVVSKHLIAN